MLRSVTWGVLLLAPVLLSCHPGDAQSDARLPVAPAFLSGDTAAARAMLQDMTIREKVAQLMMVPLYSKPGEPDSFVSVQASVAQYGLGGVIAMQGNKAQTRLNLHRLDSTASAVSGVPLLVAMDAEWGAGMRLTDGLSFPKAMALGATENPALVRAAGKAAGLELKALGVGIDFAPVADVNSNPANPVIGNRSFGSRPEHVGDLAAAWAEGLREAGVMAVGKHFPGHGDADLDSHLALPLIQSDSAGMATTELPPFETLIRRGVEGIMTAHLEVPSMDSVSGLPTSLSPLVVQSVLIDSLGFEGLVFTDALTMAGAADPVPPGTREVAALRAGNDILLFPSDPGLVLDSIEAALERGQLDTAKIDAACMKVLLAKQWIAQTAADSVTELSLHTLQQSLREHMLVRLGSGMTLDPAGKTGLIIVGNRGKAMEERLRLSFPTLTVVRLGKGAISESGIIDAVDMATSCDQLVLAFLDESNKPSRRFGLPRGASTLVNRLVALEKTLGVTLFTSSYALAYLPDAEGKEWMVAHHEDGLTQVAAMAAWCGEGAALGRLPVDVSTWKAGAGHPSPALRLPRSAPNSTMMAMGMRLDSLARAAIDMDATPGMRMLIVVEDTIRYDGTHGTLGDSKKTPVQRHHVYDLASITKVAASTMLTMISVDRGMISLDQPLSTLVPPLEDAPLDEDLGKRNLRDILAHRSGLPGWIPFYLDVMDHQDSVGNQLSDSLRAGWIPLSGACCMAPSWCDSIRHTVRSLTPGPTGKYRYSDLGYYLLQDILESVWKMPLDRLADSLIYQPLSLQRMGYHPLQWSALEDLAPTERDTLFRKAHVRGTVHDPGAAMLGGVAGHAGLFSDAHDLALLMEAMRHGGTWKGTRIVNEETLVNFTARAFPEEDSRRGTGWDKPGREPDTGASGNAGSWGSFGHSGFTGTLAWTDPEREWTAVILGNRICPDAENRIYIEEDIRTKVLEIVEQALGAPRRFASGINAENGEQ